MAGAFLVSDFGLLVMMLRAFSRDLPCCSDRTDFLFLGSWEGPRGSAGMLWARCGTGVEPDTVLGRCGPDAERGGSGAGAGSTRCSARVLLSRGAWVLSGYRAKVLPGCGIVMLPHCRARELFGRGVVMWPERGVAKHGRCRGFGRLLVYRVVLLLSLKISNATLLKLVFRYNERREFAEEQARSPPMSNLLDTPKLGFGCMRLPLTDPKDQKSIDIEHLKKMVDAFIEAGGTYFDTAYVYHEGES